MAYNKTNEAPELIEKVVYLNRVSKTVKGAMPVGQPKKGRSWWRDLTECGPLEKGMANHFSVLALRTP